MGGGALIEEWVIAQCVVDVGEIIAMNVRFGKLTSWYNEKHGGKVEKLLQ
jgi:hypothetical protein